MRFFAENILKIMPINGITILKAKAVFFKFTKAFF